MQSFDPCRTVTPSVTHREVGTQPERHAHKEPHPRDAQSVIGCAGVRVGMEGCVELARESEELRDSR